MTRPADLVFEDIIDKPWKNGPLDNQYCVTPQADGSVDIVFMGSVSWVDWISNFMFWKTPYKDMVVPWKAHAGFLEAWKSLKDIIVDELHGCRCVNVFGYSRGAAIAVLAHEWFVYNGYEVNTMVFGCPRVIAGKHSKAILDRFQTLTRYTNKGDIVTMIPPKLFGYTHVGSNVQLGTGVRFPGAKWHLIPAYRKELTK